ncbi:MAG: transposase, partial [Bacteroidota bacterium]|nr:transposase [Bacteroidota bacterium]
KFYNDFFSCATSTISYAFGMWPRISRYCKEGYYHIDNNGVENAIRPITLGRKNYLFSGNDSGSRR